MIKEARKVLFLIALSLAALVIWGSAIYYGQFLMNNYQAVSVRINDEGVNKRTLRRSFENETEKESKDIPMVTAWNRMKKQTVISEDLGFSTEVCLFEVSGIINEVYPIKLISGSIPNDEDYDGCLMDETSAFHLFGSTNVLGCTISYGSKTYYIRGIIKSEEQVLILQVADENIAFSNLELLYDNKENGRQLADDFMQQNMLSNDYTVIDGCFYARSMELLSRIPAWIIGFYILYEILRSLWNRKTLPLQLLILSAVFIFAWLILKWLMNFEVYIPERFIPTKWSDFSFWAEKYHMVKSELSQIAYIIPVPKDVIMMNAARRCISFTMITLACVIAFITQRHQILRSNTSIFKCVLIILMEIIAAVILYKTGKLYQIPKGYFCLLPVLIVADVFKQRMKEWQLSMDIETAVSQDDKVNESS